ncbi:MAG: protoporphyrinogen oxidase HemJ [Saprospiraceae bacterium]|nr:protoporphyrinogen oxidase HemJ [Saprospiraceae bacterium]
MQAYYLLFKSLHVFGFVAWFAGLFYLVRMFVYHVEANEKPQPEQDILKKQFALMENRVYKIICNPAMMITWTFGLLMLITNGLEWLRVNPWMHIKLTLLVLLVVYQLWCKRIIKKLEAGELPFNSYQFRLANEVPTILLLSIALLAVYRNTLDFLWAFLGIIGFGVLLVVFTKVYKRFRERNPEA